MSASRATILRSDGGASARAYVEFPVPASAPEPALETARVVLADPTRAPAPPGPPRGPGPRNPDQAAPPAPRPPGVELPDGLPLMKAQRIWIDPELIEQWEEEARRNQGA
jgi:hypothetical protein